MGGNIMRKNKFLTTLLGLLLGLGVCGFTACENLPFGKPDTDSVSSENTSSDESSDTTLPEDNGSSEKPEDTDKPSAPVLMAKEPDFKDLTRMDYISMVAPEKYGVKADLEEVQLSSSSRTALKATFNNIGAEVYTGEGGEWVWTWFSIDIPSANGGYSADLRKRALTLDVKTSNCSPISSVTVYDEHGKPSKEVAFNNTASENTVYARKEKLSDGWVRITLNLPLIFEESDLDNVIDLRITASNAFGDHDMDSIYFVDNVHFSTPTDAWKTPQVHNPEGYYSKDEALYVMFAGNSFIEYSGSANWLSAICSTHGANAYADYVWTPNGRIPDQYQDAFGYSGFMMEEEKPDVIFIQDFYDSSDALELGTFLEKLNTVSKSTELKVFAAENETEDGSLAASKYGVDLVNWRAAIKTLKADHGFTNSHLNYPDGVLHANELSGLVGGVMAYMDLYGEIPDVDKVWGLAQLYQGREGDLVVDFLPGYTDEDKQAALVDIMRVCAEACGLNADDICLHSYAWQTKTRATCETAGYQTGKCTACGNESETFIRPLGHDYQNGECTRCDVAVSLADSGDLANLDYVFHIPEESFGDIAIENIPLATPIYSSQSNTVSENSTSALTTKFIADGANSLIDAVEAPNGVYMSFTTLDFIAIYGSEVNLCKATLCFDLYLENCAPLGFTMFLTEQNTLLDMYYLEDFDYTSEAFSFTKSADGWYHCALDVSKMDIIYTFDKYAGVMFFFASDGYSDEAAFTLDNIQITGTIYKGDGSDYEEIQPDTETPTPPPPVLPDSNDWANLDYVSTEAIDKYIVAPELQLQTDTVSPLEESTSALRGSFHESMTDEGYDSTQDPNGDGGIWVWTAVKVDLKKIYGNSVDLTNQTLFFDVKVENCDVTSSIILLDASGKRATQIPFNNDPNNPSVSATKGFLKHGYDGWATISIYFDEVYANEDHTAIDTVYILFSNAFGDHINDSVFYLDNIVLREGCFLPPEVDTNEWGDGNMVYAFEPYNGGATPDLYLQTDTVSQNSTTAWQLDLSTYRANNPNVDINGNKWGYTHLQFVVMRDDYLNGNYNDKNLNNTKFSFDVKNVSVNACGSIDLTNVNCSYELSYPLFWDSRAESNSAVTKTDLGNGWVRFQVDLSGLFLPVELETVIAVSLVFNNQGSSDTYSTVYVDNVSFVGIKDYKPAEKDEGDFCALGRTYAVNANYSYGQVAYRLQSDVVSENSNSAMEVCFNTNSDEHASMECYFHFVFQSNDATIGGDLQDLSATTLTFDIKTENVNSCVKLAMNSGLVISWEMSQQYPFHLDNTTNPDWVTKTDLGNGWTRVSIQIFKIYPLDQITAIDYAYLVLSNENCQDENSWVYIDNVKFDGIKVSPDAY